MALSLKLRLSKASLALGVLSLLATGACGFLFVMAQPSADEVRHDVVRQTLDALRDGRDREAQLLAESLLRDPDLEFEAQGVPSYVLGIVSVREAELATIPRQRKLLYLIAASYLEQASASGFPEGETEEAEYWLAYSLKSAGRREEAVRAIQAALARPTPREAELKLLLADALLYETPRRPEEAFELLSTVPADRLADLGPQWARHAIRTQLDALMAREDYAGMQAYLKSLPPDLLSPAELQLAECRAEIVKAESLVRKGPQSEPEAKRIAAEASRRLTEIVEGDLPDFAGVSERLYLIAVAERIAGDETAALRSFERLAEMGTQESLPATLEAARMLGADGQDAAMIETYRRAAGLVGEPTQFANAWVTIDDLRDEMRTAVQRFRTREQWALAAELSQLLYPVFDQGEALEIQAQTLRDWGVRLLASAEEAPPGEDERRLAEGREKLRLAGDAFGRLAQVRFAEPEYVQDRLDAGDAYFRGNAFREAIREYLACLEYAPPTVEPDATLGLGRALLALGYEEEALKRLLRIESDYPNHPAVYSARYWAAMAFLEIGDLDAAAARLEKNLYESELTPDSRDWRDALFQFGDVQYRKGLSLKAKADEHVGSASPDDLKLRQRLTLDAENALMQAIRTYEEAAVRFPQDDRNLEVRYALAVAWRTLAQTPRDEIARTDIEITRAALVQRMKDRLAGALPWYEGIYRELAGKKDDGSLRPEESTLLRNVTFAKADVLYDLGRFQQAIDAYASASNQYHNQPEALEALAQMARCYREMGRLEEARGKIAQAKDLLARMPQDTDFAKTTRGTRAEWVSHLELLGQF